MSAMIESLARTRHAEHYAADTYRREPFSGESFSGAHAATARRTARARPLQSTRTRAGWLLVGLGLRLALPGRQDAAQRITLIGR